MRPAHHPDHQVAGGKTAAGRRRQHPAKRLVETDHVRRAGRQRTVPALHDLPVGAADPHQQALDEQLPFAGPRVLPLRHPGPLRRAGHEGWSLSPAAPLPPCLMPPCLLTAMPAAGAVMGSWDQTQRRVWGLRESVFIHGAITVRGAAVLPRSR